MLTETTYDKVPYEGYAFAETHPDRLATVAKLFSMNPPPVETCRVLEIGCGMGNNLLSIAATLPHGHFRGIDLSEKHVETAKQRVLRSQLTNVQIEQADILSIDRSFGIFDYIIAHGVLSWVPQKVQDKILDIFSTNLSANGIAYLSYNTYPGWHMRKIIRDMMLYHGKRFKDHNIFIKQGRAFLDFVAKSVQPQGHPYVALLNQELEQINKMPDWYVFHDYLEEVNDPIYFYELAEKADRAGLQYLGDAQLETMFSHNLPQKVKDTLNGLAPTIIHAEQYRDFLQYRMFRRSLFCRNGTTLNRAVDPAVIERFYIAGSFKEESGSFQSSNGKIISTDNELVKALMRKLNSIWPEWISFADLRNSLNQELAVRPEQYQFTSDTLAREILHALMESAIELHSYPTPFTIIPSHTPRMTPLVANVSAENMICPNLRMLATKVPANLLGFLPSINGKNTRAELISIFSSTFGTSHDQAATKVEHLLRDLANSAYIYKN